KDLRNGELYRPRSGQCNHRDGGPWPGNFPHRPARPVQFSVIPRSFDMSATNPHPTAAQLQAIAVGLLAGAGAMAVSAKSVARAATVAADGGCRSTPRTWPIAGFASACGKKWRA